MNKYLVAFDLDGVLADACDIHFNAFNEALTHVGAKLTTEEHMASFNGLPTKTKLNILVEQGRILKEDIPKIEWWKQYYTLNLIDYHIKTDKTKIELFEALWYNDVNVAVVTNSIRKTTYAMLHNIGILPYINLVITNEDVLFPKPDPQGYCKAMDRFKVDGKNTIIVEDSLVGIKAAKASGALTVLEVKKPSDVNYSLIKNELVKIGAILK